MSQKLVAYVSRAVLGTAVIAIAHSGSALAVPSTVENDQTDLSAVAASARVVNVADARNQAKDDNQKDDDAIKKLPKSVSKAVFKDLAKRTKADVSTFRIVKVERQEWSNGCLGLEQASVSCTQAIVPGYQVVVLHEQEYWVYRTDASGSVIAYDTAASQALIAQQSSQQVVTTETQTTTATSSSTTSSSATSDSATASSNTSTGSTTATSSTQVSFKDVSSSYWASTFISELTKLTIVEGFPDNTFRPNDMLTKAQFAALVSKAFDHTETREAIAFRDVAESYWAYTAIRKAYAMGLLSVDTNNDFNPTRQLTRLDVLITLAQALNYTTTTRSVSSILSVYKDAASIPASYRTLIAALTERGLIVNYPHADRLELARVITRSEVTAFLYQAMASVGKVQPVASPYIVKEESVRQNRSNTNANTSAATKKRHCNQGIGNGSEGCDPGNSQPHGGSNDEGGRTPGNK